MARKLAGGARGLSDLRLGSDGAQLFPRAAATMLPALEGCYASAPSAPGRRITRLGALAPFLTGSGAIAELVAQVAGPAMRPVRAIAFDKSPEASWALGWHQDRSINVAAPAQVEGYGPSTIKQGSPHVEPPFAVIAAMLTLRIHLDPVPPDNAPLQIALGTHQRGYIAEPDVPAVVAAAPIAACLAQSGDVWAYATPILHASQRSLGSARRRVLQVDFCAELLLAPLEWALQI
jgi:hypothetical protein